jgi:hypothetical protein
LEACGFIKDIAKPEKLDEILSTQKITVYGGFDLTAKSLHIGNLMQIMLLGKYFIKQNGENNLEANFKVFCKERSIALGKILPVMRGCLIGKASSIGVFEIIYILGFEESLKRMENL